MNRVVYEGATNLTITCKSNASYLDWEISPFAVPEFFDSSSIYLTTNGEPSPSFYDFFAIDHSQGTEVYSIVVFNATISPPDNTTFSTAGVYLCRNSEQNYIYLVHLVVIRKYELPTVQLFKTQLFRNHSG